MGYLSLTTCLWAFSFSLIGVYLSGQVDAWFSVVSRIVIATLVFLPFLRFKGLTISMMIKLMILGAFQLGIMYCFYYQSFLYLSTAEVLLFTAFTPIYVTLIYDLLRRCFSPWYLVSTALAVLGALVIQFVSVNPDFMLGFFIVQGANICFAIGQVGYKILMEKAMINISQRSMFAFFYLGALLVTLPAFLLLGDLEKLPTTNTQWVILLYLGSIASGLGYYLWNKGATLVNTGTLAVMNNALIPVGILVNVLIWNRNADLSSLSIGGMIILLSLWLNETWIKRKINKQQNT